MLRKPFIPYDRRRSLADVAKKHGVADDKIADHLKYVQSPEQVKMIEKVLMGAGHAGGKAKEDDDAEAVAVLTYMFPGFEIRSLTDIE